MYLSTFTMFLLVWGDIHSGSLQKIGYKARQPFVDTQDCCSYVTNLIKVVCIIPYIEYSFQMHIFNTVLFGCFSYADRPPQALSPWYCEVYVHIIMSHTPRSSVVLVFQTVLEKLLLRCVALLRCVEQPVQLGEQG